MSQIHTENLPRAQQRYLHKDFIENEKHYWTIRDRLLREYRGQWVAIHDGKIVASSLDIFDLVEQVGKMGGHPYIAKVGEEDSLVFKVRQRGFSYDEEYKPFALPQAEINGAIFPSFIQSLPGGKERILGRDVLNQIKVTFDGPRQQITFEF